MRKCDECPTSKPEIKDIHGRLDKVCKNNKSLMQEVMTNRKWDRAIFALGVFGIVINIILRG